MAIVLRVVTEFLMKGGSLVVELAEDDVTGDLEGFRFTNTTSFVGQFSAMRVAGNGRRPWRDRAEVPVGTSRMDVPNNIKTADDLDYWTSPMLESKWR